MNELQVSRVCERVPLPEQSVVSVDLCRWICVYERTTVCALQQLCVVVCMYPTLGLGISDPSPACLSCQDVNSASDHFFPPPLQAGQKGPPQRKSKKEIVRRGPQVEEWRPGSL